MNKEEYGEIFSLEVKKYEEWVEKHGGNMCNCDECNWVRGVSDSDLFKTALTNTVLALVQGNLGFIKGLTIVFYHMGKTVALMELERKAN